MCQILAFLKNKCWLCECLRSPEEYSQPCCSMVRVNNKRPTRPEHVTSHACLRALQVQVCYITYSMVRARLSGEDARDFVAVHLKQRLESVRSEMGVVASATNERSWAEDRAQTGNFAIALNMEG